jgi:nucleoid-associated protein YgaU
MKFMLAAALMLAVALAPGCKKPDQPPVVAAEEAKPLDVAPLEPPVTETAPPATPAARAPVAPPITTIATPPATPAGKTYTVQQGDTIYGISRKLYGSDKRAKDIIAANPGIDANKLKVGQVIKLPS